MAGITGRFNAGVDLQFRSVRTDSDRSAFPGQVFLFGNHPNAQTRLSSIGPKIKVIPFGRFPRFSFQSTLYIPLFKDQEGDINGRPFLDYDKLNWWTQFFLDKPVKPWLNLFFGVDFLARVGGSSQRSNLYQLPLTFIATTFPTNKVTFYSLFQFFPEAGLNNAGYLNQMGMGLKYQVGRQIELEALYNKFISGRNSGSGESFNLGIRYIRLK